MPQQTQTKTIRERFNAILIDYFGIGEYPTDDVKLYEWMDDLYDLIELAMALEEEFSIEIDDGDLERVETVGELFKLVEEAGS